MYFLFCFPLYHVFIFSCTSVGVSSHSSKKSLNVHTQTHSCWLTFSPTSTASTFKKHSGSASQTVMHVAGLLYCSLFGLKNLLSAGHSGVKKEVSGLALSSCFSGEYKVPVDKIQTSGCLREGERKASWRATFCVTLLPSVMLKKNGLLYSFKHSKKVRSTKWPPGLLAFQTQFIKSSPPFSL